MKTRVSIIAALLLAVSVNAGAQSFETGYFLDNWSYGFRINPSFQNETNVVGAIIGNFTVNAASNTGLGQFIYPDPNGSGLVTGFNSAISSETFLKDMPQNIKVTQDVGVNIATVCFWDKQRKAYHNIEANVRAFGTEVVPSELFSYLKNGGYTSYDMSGTNARVNSFIELAYGYSRKASDMITFGGRVKILLGTGAVQANSATLTADNSNNRIALNVDNTIRMALPGASFGPSGTIDFSKFSYEGGGISGFGAAVDLGITFRPIEDLEASLAITDLGGISNNYNICGENKGAIVVDNVSSSSEALEDFLNELSVFKQTASTRSFDMLPTNVNAGIRYKMPFYRGLSAGLFGTWRNYKNASYWSARLGATITPTNWFSFTANYGYCSYGSTVGGALSISGGAFNFYVGLETFLGKITAYQNMPLGKFKTTLNTGITFRF